jgi:hypothetical protein
MEEIEGLSRILKENEELKKKLAALEAHSN